MEQVINKNLCVSFAFAFAQYNHDGKEAIEALVMAGNDFKKEIKNLFIGKKTRGYLFTDNTYCIYNTESGYFKFRSPIKQKVC